ncbi:magnesium transporter CorA family protein [Candidatus Neptunichlamydia sp. REUL1]|uniref:magnesium transporter CorA family protein n=1 Tax=Candidatus Neptunichlamydia sp. REUL1 TaxID=3064277 RepID=UPI0029318434|nr:magnesium transporter CorA family protein [Candidatus Neptunochlamydia sp. REUL1]
MITIYDKGEHDDEFIEIPEPKEGCWIHVEDATTNDINQISKLIDLEYTDMYDSLDRYEIPRVEKVNETVLVFTRHPMEPEAGLYTTTFTIILTKDYFITICPQKSQIVENFISQKPKLSPSNKSKFIIYILLKITQEYTLQIKKIRTSVLKQEKKMSYVDSRDITNLTHTEEILNQYLSSLVPMRSVLESITSGRYTLLYEKDQDLLEDLLNASIQSEDLCSINLRSIRSLRDSYQIIFTNQLNKTIKLLTALTIILSIPTMIASLYGMNVSLPGESAKYAFSVIMVLIVGLSILSLILFQRKKWL